MPCAVFLMDKKVQNFMQKVLKNECCAVQTPAPSSSGHKPAQLRGQGHCAILSYAFQSLTDACAFL